MRLSYKVFMTSALVTLALVADLGGGQKLWLKADETTRGLYEAAGCERFTYLVQGSPKQMNYYSAPADAMESPALMLPWARLALQAAPCIQPSLRPLT